MNTSQPIGMVGHLKFAKRLLLGQNEHRTENSMSTKDLGMDSIHCIAL